MKIIKIKTAENKIKNYKLDFVVCDNLYHTDSIDKVKSNIKNFEIVVNKAKSKKHIGQRYSKIFNNVIITYHMWLPIYINGITKDFEICYQFLVNDKTKISDILSFKELEPFKEILIDGIEIAKVNTIEDMISVIYGQF